MRKRRTFQVEIELSNDRAHSLKSGMFTRAEITTSRSNKSLVVPSNALIETEGSLPSVYIVKDSIAFLKTVDPGMGNDSLVEIRSGLSPQDIVVTFGQQNLKDGSRIKSIMKM